MYSGLLCVDCNLHMLCICMNVCVYTPVHVCVCVYVRVCMRACVRACVCERERAVTVCSIDMVYYCSLSSFSSPGQSRESKITNTHPIHTACILYL